MAMENRKKFFLMTVIALVVMLGSGFMIIQGGQQELVTASESTAQQDTEASSVVHTEYSSLVQNKCLTCHAVKDGVADRISGVRKTPEGWQDTINRMQRLWGVKLTREESAEIVKELSYTNGLAPEEMERVMYWLTETGSTFEPVVGHESIQQSCLGCHAAGRALAQYRTEEEWQNIKDFHLGMNPSLVFQVRDVNWVEVSEQAIQYLAEINKRDSEEWARWQEANIRYDVTGKWKIVGYQPGVGKYSGTAEISKQGDDFFEKRTLYLANGEEVKYEGTVRLYSGYSLRSSLEGNEERLRGVYNVKDNGQTIVGRWNKVGDKGIYADETYYKATQPALLDVWPQSLKVGSEGTFRVIASGLPENITKHDIQVSDQLEVVDIVQQTHGDLWIKLKASPSAKQGKATISLNGVEQGVKLTLYEQIERLEVLPEFGLARIGDGEDAYKQSVQFEAIGYTTGEDGQELPVGPVDVTWGLEEYYTFDIEDDDIEFVGTIDSKTGLFTPAASGPNPERFWSTNNVGNVTVVAVYQDPVTGEEVKGSTFLIVSLPNYLNIK